MVIPDDFWGVTWPYGPEQPPATEADIRRWEERYGLVLPATLAAALRVQNGGSVYWTNVLICPLSEITPLTGARWAHLWEDETNRAFGEPSRLVAFGQFEEFPASLILNYNAGREPPVICLWHDLGDELRDHADGPFDDFLRVSRERHRLG